METFRGHLTIGQAARNAGVGVETIRFYERRGLIEACGGQGPVRECPILDALDPEVGHAEG